MRIPLPSRYIWICAFIVLCINSSVALFAEEPFRDRGSGYIYYGTAAPMDSSALNYPLGVGVGGQIFLIRGLSAGADFGYYMNPGYNDVHFRLFSADLGYHFLDRRRFHAFDPFVVGGWSVFSDRRNVNLSFGGVGLDTWFNKHMGARFEMRVHVQNRGTGLGTFRIGLLLR